MMRWTRAFLSLPLLSCLLVCGEPGQTGETSARLDALFARLDEHRLFRGAALVSDGGQVVYTTARGPADEAWGIPNTVDTRHLILSLSKQFAAVLVLQLAGEGRLSLEDPLQAHLTGLPEAWSGKVTANHLLSQTSGIPDYVLLPDYEEVTGKKRFTREEFFRLICGDPLFTSLGFTPGEKWEYSNTNYFLLGILAETVAGLSYEELVERRIFAPLEMHDSGVYDSRKVVPMLAEGHQLTYSGEVQRPAHTEFSPKSVPSGGLYSTAHDLLKWSAALRDGRLLTPAMQEVFITPTHFVEGDTGYVCGQWREFRTTPGGARVEIFSHGGSATGMSSWLLRVPAEDRCIVLLHNGGSAYETVLEQVALAILDVLDGGQGELPPLDLIGPLAGTYLNDRKSLFEHYRLLKEHHGDIYDFGPKQLSTIGRVLIERVGDRDTALALFRLNVEEHPDSPLTHRDLGGLLLEDGFPGQALPHLLRTRELSPEPDAELDAWIAKARAGVSSAAADWLQWGGPNRNFSVQANGLADLWPDGGPRTLWSRNLGEGYSGIVAADGLVYTMYRKGRTDDDEWVIALDARTGETVWERRNSAPMAEPPDSDWGGQGPNATPLIVGERLLTVGSNVLAQCFDRKSGRLIWQRDLAGEFGASYTARGTNIGHASSPIAYRNTIIVALGHPGPSRSEQSHSLVALDLGDGDTVWKSQSFENGFSSPILIEFGGVEHLVLHARRELLGVDPTDGSLLWRHPVPHGGAPMVTPSWLEGNRILVHEGGQGGQAHLVELTVGGSETVPRERWANPLFAMYVSSPVQARGYLYGSSEQSLVALDAATGERVWAEPGFPNASILHVGEKLVLLDENGVLTLATPTPEGLTVHSRHAITEKYSLTAPTLVGRTLFVRDQRRILALDLGSAAAR